MAVLYVGDPQAVQAPASAPGDDVPFEVEMPEDGDGNNVATMFNQQYRAKADYIEYCKNFLKGAKSIMNFRAVGDGVTDDSAAIQTAITATPTGGKLLIPGKDFLIAGSGVQCLLISKQISLIGLGWSSRLLVDAAVPNTRDIIRVAGSSTFFGLELHNFAIAANTGGAKTITNALFSVPISITAAAHGYSTGDTVTVSGVGGTTNANGTWVITVVDANTFTLNGSVGNANYTSGGTAKKVPGRHAINLDVTSSNVIANIKVSRLNVSQCGGRALVTTNPTPYIDGVFVAQIRDNILRGGINLSKAGDSFNIRDNEITGAFNGIDVDLVTDGAPGGGAHLLVIEGNNITSQGAAVRVRNGNQFRIVNNNCEPNLSIDVSNAPNNATIDLDGNSSTPIYGAVVRENYCAGFGLTGNVCRVEYTHGALLDYNDFEQDTAGPFNYVIGSHATATVINIPVNENGGLPSSQISDAGANTIVHFYNPSGDDEYGASTSARYVMKLIAGVSQAGHDLWSAYANNRTTIWARISDVGNFIVGNNADDGNQFQVGGNARVTGNVTSLTGLLSNSLEKISGTLLTIASISNLTLCAPSYILRLYGSILFPYTVVADGPITMDAGSMFVVYTSLTATHVVTLPIGVLAGQIACIKNGTSNTSALVITPPGGGHIDNASTLSVGAAYSCTMLLSYGSNEWGQIGKCVP